MENIDLRIYADSSFFFFFINGNFFIEIVNRLQGKFLLISGFTHRQGGSLLQPLRRCCLPEMIDEPIWKLPCSFQRVKHFYFFLSFFFFFFFDQCLFLVRKCSGRRFLNLSCAFPCNFFLFLTSTCSAEICIVMSTSIFEIFRINNMSAARELAIRGKKVSLLCFNISIIRERMKKLSSICSPPVG